MKLSTKMLAAARGGLVRGTGQFVEHAVRNTLLLLLALAVIYFGGGYVLHWLGGFIPHIDIGWPDWMHWPRWFSGEATADVTTAPPVEPIAQPVETVADCDGWGWHSICWKN